MTPPTDKSIVNEQTKLLANAVNIAATSCFTVGIATPLAGYVYNVSNLQGTLNVGTLVLGIAGWLAAAFGLHFLARRTLRALKP